MSPATRVVLTVLFAGCGVTSPSDQAEVSQPVDICPVVVNTRRERSLLIQDPAVLERFSFERTMTQILASAGSSEAARVVFQRWMGTFGAPPGSPGIDPEGYGIVTPRANEAALALVDPFDPNTQTRFRPLALVNRFDLTPTSGARCGEYRIVYGMESTVVLGRALMIFEGSLPNPHPENGVDGCLPVARFWQNQSAVADVQQRAANLEAFYYGGLPGFSPVVAAGNYGLGGARDGQVRTNFFVDVATTPQWQLREFKLLSTCGPTCVVNFQHVTVKANPANELFGDRHPRSADFQREFLSRLNTLVVGPDGGVAQVNDIALQVSDVFNEYESISQPQGLDALNYVEASSQAFRVAIRARLKQLKSPVTVDDVLRRAETQTCGGCHELSTGAELGPGQGTQWPSSGIFVHLSEHGGVSPALTDQFLPHRQQVLEAFLNARCRGVVQPLEPGRTLGGSPEGAPN